MRRLFVGRAVRFRTSRVVPAALGPESLQPCWWSQERPTRLDAFLAGHRPSVQRPRQSGCADLGYADFYTRRQSAAFAAVALLPIRRARRAATSSPPQASRDPHRSPPDSPTAAGGQMHTTLPRGLGLPAWVGPVTDGRASAPAAGRTHCATLCTAAEISAPASSGSSLRRAYARSPRPARSPGEQSPERSRH